MNSNLLSQALKLCGNPAFGLYISSMECVRPSSVPEILSSLAGQREKQFYAEIKYDGERFGNEW